MDHSHHNMGHSGHNMNQKTHDKHAGHHTADFLTKFWVSLALSVPIFFYSEMARMVFGIQAPMFSGASYVMLGLGSIVFFYGGLIFLTSAYGELKARLPGMMTLIAIAIIAAYLYSLFSIIFGQGHDLLFELASLITIMLLGHWIEMKSVAGAQGALKELAKLLPDTAEVERESNTEIIPVSELVIGDVVLIRPGRQVPADGVIISGQSDLNEAIITGESKPVGKKIGDLVIAGSINGDGSLRIRVATIGEQTFLAGVMRLVAEAQVSKSRLQMISDQAAFYLTIIAIVVGPITFAVWLLADAGLIVATERLVAVLVITCPHALGLAVPLVASISTTMAAKNGLLVKERRALEAARDIDTVLFDKTGTLTKGEFGVTDIMPFNNFEKNEAVRLAASVNQTSEHLLAKAIVAKARELNLALTSAVDFKRLPGQGAEALVDNQLVAVGNESVVPSKELAAITLAERERLLGFAKQGRTIIYVVQTGTVVGALVLADIIRPEAREAIKTLNEQGIKIAMITGDAPEVAAWVAGELGITEYFAGVHPAEKSAKVKLLQADGAKVAMVGDGVNDAPALTQADIGIAIGAGTNVAIESAGIILVKNDPRDIPKIIRLSKLTYTKMIQNLFWATGYNVVAIPLAAGVLATKGIILEPALAAVFMSASTVIVAFNAVLLKRQVL